MMTSRHTIAERATRERRERLKRDEEKRERRSPATHKTSSRRENDRGAIE
jgi:hypothetical protein